MGETILYSRHCCISPWNSTLSKVLVQCDYTVLVTLSYSFLGVVNVRAIVVVAVFVVVVVVVVAVVVVLAFCRGLLSSLPV